MEQSTLLGIVFKGSASDFNTPWFKDIGNTIVGAMLFNIYWPLIEFFSFYFMRVGKRWLDRNFGFNSNKTKKTTV